MTVLQGKIAVEEHFATPELAHLISGVGWPKDQWDVVIARLQDIDERLAEMDRLGIETQVLSLGSFGIQAVPQRADAVRYATEANDALAEITSRPGGRFLGFAAVALQDPAAAADELERCVRAYGFVGALVNGFSDLGDEQLYYDDPRCEPFWERAASLGVPVYLHPRNPADSQRLIYEGRSELLGPTWAFAVETGTHALRLITSGLFDRHPSLTLIVGHLGEFLPFALARLQARMSHLPQVRLQRPPREYLSENFYITTSGNNHYPSLLGTLLEVGAQRLLFATDYPFEEMADGALWFDGIEIAEPDRRAIAFENARRLFRL